ncbi:SAM-dependent methyltransferase [Paenibacillus castaneae]|uniref:class I SAM-dependent methyltransferase n=1 Tax=Paenibacillus castaneae TaxID=474957 RepID=UPI000C9CCCEF|nr:class I SAM-dependent methyltransferase [Paenibacillus castaneae]NIK77255.1 SAM-dependent methyltransferase [Paenibacillus castaneae]
MSSPLNRTEEARFFISTDPKTETMVYPLPAAWWSRPYEYEWCRTLVSPEDVALDAACGISHPLKFYLGGVCAEVYACDFDARINSWHTMQQEIINDIGEDALHAIVSHNGWSKVRYAHASITDLPYEDDTFDIIFCVSVLEHLNHVDQDLCLKEFARTVKPGGRIALTFDYPTVDLQQLKRSAESAGLAFANEFDDILVQNAIHSDIWGRLYCFRALLTKPQI